MKKLIKLIVILIAVVCVWSFLPVVGLYLSKSPVPYTNESVIKRIEKNEGDYFEFIVLSDNHAGLFFNDSAALKVIKNINREDRFRGKVPIDFVAAAGDVTFRGSRWDYNIYNKLRSRIKYPVVTAIGNHDDDRGGFRFFKQYIGKDEFAFADRNSYFIFVNDIIGDMGSEEFSRLENELVRSADYAHRFIVLHKPPIAPCQQSWYRPELSPWSYRFLKLCEKYNVDMVFAGHEHMSKEIDLGGVKYAGAGGGGMMLHHPSEEGGVLNYIVVKVYGDYVYYEVRQIFPPAWEYFTFYMWKDLFYFLRSVFI